MRKFQISNFKYQIPRLVFFTSVFVAMFAFFILGVSSARASTFTDSVNALGTTNPATLHLSAGSYAVDSDFEIPWNVTLHFDEGAVINVASGVTLVVSGTIDDCNNQIFNDSNTDPLKGVKLNVGSVLNVRPEWWGAKADDNPASATLNGDAIEKAMAALYTVNDTNAGKMGQRVELSVGKYYINRTINLKLGAWIVGQGDIGNYNNVSVLRLVDNSNCAMLTDQGNGSGGGLVNIFFHGGSQSSKEVGLDIEHNLHNFLLKNNGFSNFNDFAVYMPAGGGHRAMVEGNIISNSYNGMMLGIYDGQVENNSVNFTGEYGIQLQSFDSTFQSNHVSGGTSGINCFSESTGVWAQVVKNEFKNCDYGVVNIGSGTFSENLISNNRHDGIHAANGVGSGTIANNTITANGGYGIFINGFGEGSRIRENNVSGNGQGGMNVNISGHIDAVATGLDEYALIENNPGFDGPSDGFQTLSSASAPSVISSSKWQTNNASPATITDFTKAPRGKEIYLKFGDPRTTLKFSANPSANKIQNGDFVSGSGWLINQFWSLDTTDHAAKHSFANDTSLDGNNPLSQDIGAVKDEYYEVKYTIKNYVSGGLMPVIITDPWHYTLERGFAPSFGNGTYTRIVKAEAATSLKFIAVAGVTSFVGEIDDVSARKIDTALRGFGGADKTFAQGDEIRCLLGADTAWYCDDAKLAFNEISSADLNSDTKVDTTDLGILKTDFLKLTPALANPKSDINADGQATIRDVGIMMSQWKP